MPITYRSRQEPLAFAARLGAATAAAALLCTACGGQEARTPPLPRPLYSLPFDIKPVVAPYTTGAVTARAVGSFQILEEKDTATWREMHIPHGWTKIHLSFTTDDRRANVTLVDNGTELTINVQVPACDFGSYYHQYREGDDESHLYDEMDRLFTITVERVHPEQVTGCLSRLAAAIAPRPAC